jgi:uncharacterized membrane protein YfcA
MHPVLEFFLLVFVGFATGFINTIAGGGSLVTLPILIFLGLPADVANGTNRIPIFFQSVVSIAGYRSKGLKVRKFAWYLSIMAFAGALVGANLALDVKGELFNRILAIVMVVVVIFMLIKPRTAAMIQGERLTGKYFWISFFLFFFIGIYAGFIQAGTGIFTLLALSSVNHISLVKGNVIKALMILILTTGALTLFILNVEINWRYGLYMALGNAVGAWWSSRWSVNKGDGTVKLFLMIMVVAMAVKLWFF